ncbi:hypothetical protein HGQ98_12025, partial [Achromobacter ruhlandii]|nr:hypothetical protein [Achromobacter ruhlandii]
MTAALPLLRVDGLRKSFGGIDALADVSFQLEAGRMLALIGPERARTPTRLHLPAAPLPPPPPTAPPAAPLPPPPLPPPRHHPPPPPPARRPAYSRSPYPAPLPLPPPAPPTHTHPRASPPAPPTPHHTRAHPHRSHPWSTPSPPAST